MPLRETIEQVRPSVFEICRRTAPHGVTNFECIGTGFLIARGWVATCNHVVNGRALEQLGVRYHLGSDNQEASGAYNVIAVHHYPDQDLALMNVHQQVGSPHAPASLGHASDSWVGEQILSAGYPLGWDMQETSRSRVPMVTSGIVGNLVYDLNPRRLRHYVLDITAHPGCSGSPVFAADRGVVGILNAGHPVYVAETSAGSPNFRIGVGHARAIPIEDAVGLLADHGVAV